MQPTNLKTIIRSTRPPFLILTPVCVFLGASLVIARERPVDFFFLTLAFIGALSAHISVNALNEYFDFNSGLDLETQRTPFSGGSGALLVNPKMLRPVLVVGVIFLIATTLVGAYFTILYGWKIIPIGVVGVVLVVTYTRLINRSPYLCLISPGLGFGLLMVVGTQFVLEGHYSTLPWLVAFVPFFLVNNLLLLNQYPDIQADTNAGRRNLPIAYGIVNSNRVYGLFASITVVLVVGLVMLEYLPKLSLLALTPMPLALFSLRGIMKYGRHIGRYPQYLGANLAVAMLVPLILGVSIIFG